MKTTRPVFESFSAFVNNLYEMESQYPGFLNSLNEGDTSYASPLLELLKGAMKLDAAGKAEVNTLITGTFNKIFTDTTGPGLLMNFNGKDEIAFIIETLKEGIEALSNSSGLKTVAGSVVSSVVEPGFEYLKSGTVRGKDLPVLDSTTEGNNTDEPTDPSLAMFLAVINGHNLLALYNNITSAKRGKAYLNAGSEANLNQFAKMAADQGYKENTFLEIDTESLSTQMIVLQPYTSTYAKGKVKKDDPIKYGWQFPLYGIPDINGESAITKGGGDIIDASYYDKVVEPGGNEVAVEDKQYSAPPEASFFPADGVIISDSGKQALNLILSEFNSISTIVVHGGASSSPTTRAGGNEQLAKDRQAAGIAQLEALKKAKVKQLTNAVISKGTASVQTSDPKTPSDPTKQQVSFTISGMIRQINVTPTKAVVIPKMETLMADSVTFTKYIFQLNVSAEPNAKNMAKRSD